MILENHKIDDYNDDSIICGYCPENLREEELKTFVPLFTVIQYDIGLLRGQEWESGTGLEWFVWYKKQENHWTYPVSTKPDPFYTSMDADGKMVRGFVDDRYYRIHILSISGEGDRYSSYGGISLVIDRWKNEPHVVGVGEDDGWFFPETLYWRNLDKEGINKWELWRLCQAVGDIRWESFGEEEDYGQELKNWLYCLERK
jgi:hypothetical protein